MVFLLAVVVAICFVASPLPFLFPGPVMRGLGVPLNAWLAAFPAGSLRTGAGGARGLKNRAGRRAGRGGS